MKNIKNYSELERGLVEWIKKYAQKTARKDTLVIGVSGGIDSAVVSTLCAKTGLRTIVLEMPIHQKKDQVSNGKLHIEWLKNNFQNVESFEVNLERENNVYDQLIAALTESVGTNENIGLADANTRSRLRMLMLYFTATIHNGLVVGTGNKIEDFGIMFFSKFGDGGVDISPIGDLMKSEVRALGRHMGVNEIIVNAKPTDGLWDDGRGDEDQIGATYDELEWAMNYIEKNPKTHSKNKEKLTIRQCRVLEIYKKRHLSGKHKIKMPPIYKIKNK